MLVLKRVLSFPVDYRDTPHKVRPPRQQGLVMPSYHPGATSILALSHFTSHRTGSGAWDPRQHLMSFLSLAPCLETVRPTRVLLNAWPVRSPDRHGTLLVFDSTAPWLFFKGFRSFFTSALSGRFLLTSQHSLTHSTAYTMVSKPLCPEATHGD